MKKSISLLTALSLSAMMILSGCSSGASTSANGSSSSSASSSSGSTFTHNFTVTTPLADTHSAVTAINNAFAEISEKTGGRITGQVFASSQLASGQMATAMDMVVKGTIDMQFAGNSIYGSYIKDYEVLGTPFLFETHEVADQVLYNDEIYDYYSQKCEETNLHLLGYMENAWMVYTNSKHEVKVPSDLKGLKMRCGDGDLVEAAMIDAGASIVYLSLTDLYTSLQQGVVDGQDNGIEGAIYTNKLYEVQDYLTNIEVTYSPFVFVVNNELWKTIPESDQAIMTEVFDKYMKEQVEYNRSLIAPNLQEIIDYGVNVYTPTEEEAEIWRTEMGAKSPAVSKVLAENYNQDFVAMLLDVVEEANNATKNS